MFHTMCLLQLNSCMINLRFNTVDKFASEDILLVSVELFGITCESQLVFNVACTYVRLLYCVLDIYTHFIFFVIF
jgi:hypothetical protein